MKTKNIKIKIYHSKIKVITNVSKQDIYVLRKKYNLLDFSKYDAITFKNKDGRLVVIFLRHTNKIITHEIVHLKNLIFNFCGIQLDSINDESEAYLTSHIFSKIEKFTSNVT